MSRDILYVVATKKALEKTYCCLLLLDLNKAVNVVKQEHKRLKILEEQCHKKQQIYYELSRSVSKKLNNLADISHHISQFDNQRSLEVTEFVNNSIKTWLERTANIEKEFENVMLVSITNPNATVKTVIDRIIAITTTSKEAYQRINPHAYCAGRFNTIYNEMLPLFTHLKKVNQFLQNYFSLTKSITELSKLESSVDQYRISLQTFLPPVHQTVTAVADSQNSVLQPIAENGELSAFQYVVQLLNGELLAEHNYLHHHAKITPLVTDEYILPDAIPEVVKTPETGRDTRIIPETQNGTEIKPCSTLQNVVLLNERSTDLPNAPQKAAKGVIRIDSQRSVHGERAGGNKVLHLESSSSASSSSRSLLRTNLSTVKADRGGIYRRKMPSGEETSDLQPIKIPKLKTDLLKPLP